MGNIKANISILLTLILQAIFTYGMPQDFPVNGNGKMPFGNCHHYELGGIRGKAKTDDVKIKGTSKFAFLPLTEEENKLRFHINYPEGVFKVNIDGTLLTVEKCDTALSQCSMEDEGGVKIPDYIKSRQWNMVEISIHHEKLTISIDKRTITSVPIKDYKNMEEATWSVLVDEFNPSKSKTFPKDNLLYMVQFDCQEHPTDHANPEYIPIVDGTTETFGHHPLTTPSHYFSSPQYQVYGTTPHYYGNEEHGKGKKFGYEGLIIGLIVGALVVIVIIVVSCYVFKKRKSANISEQSPLKPHTKN